MYCKHYFFAGILPTDKPIQCYDVFSLASHWVLYDFSPLTILKFWWRRSSCIPLLVCSIFIILHYSGLVSDQAKSSSSIYRQNSPNFLVSLFHILESKIWKYRSDLFLLFFFVNKSNKNANISKEKNLFLIFMISKWILTVCIMRPLHFSS